MTLGNDYGPCAYFGCESAPTVAASFAHHGATYYVCADHSHGYDETRGLA